MKTISSYLILIFFLFTGFLSPQKPINKEELKTSSQSEFEQELRKYRDSILLCVDAVEKSKKVLYLNEGYIKNLDKKIVELEQKKTEQASEKIVNKGEISIPENSLEIKVFHLDSTCISERNWVGRQLNKTTCREWKIDTLWATLK